MRNSKTLSGRVISRRRSRGAIFIYLIVMLSMMLAITSIAVDFGRVGVTREELQRCADATALGVMTVYGQSGYTAASIAGPSIMAANPVDSGSGIQPFLTMVGGTWNSTTRTFSTSYAPGTSAVQITVSRTKAHANPLQLFFTGVLGFRSWDVSATAIATQIDPASVPVTVPSTANTYFAGMPGGTTNSWGDNMSNATPYQASSLPVTPGTWITVSNLSGTTCIVPGYTGTYDTSGNSSLFLHHGENYDHSNFGIGPQNGIADAILPASAMTGLFLGSGQPDATATPSTVVDWSNPAQANKASYTDLAIKTPFMIGDGKTSGGTAQKFLVPQGATRLYLSIWDGVTSSNNSGSLSATLSSTASIRLVQ